MKKIKPSDLAGFVKDEYNPYTDYNQEIADWLELNAVYANPQFGHNKYIFAGFDEFYQHYIKYGHDVYYTNEQFKEWIGMNKHTTAKEKLASILNNEGQQVLDYLEGKVVNKMPKLVAGRHYVRFSNGRFGQVMDGYINYVSIGEDAWDIRITGWDSLGDSVAGAIVEVFDNVFSNSNQYTHLDYFNSGKITIWKKEDERKQRIEQELEFAKAKAERLATHISILEQKLK
jgi:hypothetical protein